MFDEVVPSPDDPSQWPLCGLRELDNSLRCPICHDFFETTMMLNKCYHSYCSLCIRRYLSTDSHCPSCRQNASESDLINNRLVDDIVRLFVQNRKELLNCAIRAPSAATNIQKPANFGKCNGASTNGSKSVQADSSLIRSPIAHSSPSVLSTRRSTRINIAKVEASPTSSPTQIIAPKSDIVRDSDSILCPVCNASVRSTNINVHLDTCLANSQTPPSKNVAVVNKNSMKSITDSDIQNKIPDQVNAVMKKKMPKVCYNLIKDAKLKSMLADLSLPTHGDRSTLVWRYSEYITLHNANSDALLPLPAVELRKKLEDMDKLRPKATGLAIRPKSSGSSTYGTPTHPLLSIDSNINAENHDNSEMSFDAQCRNYVNIHHAQFEELTQDIIRRKKKKEELNS